MSFEPIIRRWAELAFERFNAESYDELFMMMSPDIVLSTPPINLEKITMPEVRISGREDVISYWRELRSQYSNVITHYEFLEIGKRSIIKTIYGDLEMVVIVEILLDQYGKATRVINHLGTYVAEG